MNTIKLEPVVKYGTIDWIAGDNIKVGSVNPDGSLFAKWITPRPYDDVSDFYVGEEIVILEYNCPSPIEIKSLYGIVDRKKYDSAVRDSQKLPKGWKHEPYIGFCIIQGELSFFEDDYMTYAYVQPEGEKEYCFEEFEGFNIAGGDDVVVTGYGITFPDGRKKLYDVTIYNKDEYYNKYEASAKAYYYDEYYSDKRKTK